MPNLQAILITTFGLSFYFYMTQIIGLIILASLFSIILILIYFNQNMLLYMPIIPGMPKSPSQNSFGLRHPNQHNLQAIDLHLNTSDGVIIRGWHVKANPSKRIIIYFHENAGNIGTRLYYVRQICKNTLSDVILVAYRGYSDSESHPSEHGLALDSYAVMEYAYSYAQDHNLPIYILGRSLGGAVAINLASQEYFQRKIQGLILQNTFTNIGDMIDALMPVLRYFKFLQRNHWPSIDRIGKVKCPILFIKSLKDEIVPPVQMHRLMQAATANKREYQIKKGTHNSSWDLQPSVYFSRMQEFFKELEGANQ